VANKVKAKSAHPVTPSAASVVAVVVAVVNALRMVIKQPLQSAMSRETRDARKAALKGAMVVLSAIVALMKTATMPRWSKTPQPLSVLTPS
jgi:hypothetical protein